MRKGTEKGGGGGGRIQIFETIFTENFPQFNIKKQTREPESPVTIKQDKSLPQTLETKTNKQKNTTFRCIIFQLQNNEDKRKKKHSERSR